jgi:hypothetical protein
VRECNSPWPGGILAAGSGRPPCSDHDRWRPMWLCCWRCRHQISSRVMPAPAHSRPGAVTQARARRPPSEGLACRSCQVCDSPPIAIDGFCHPAGDSGLRRQAPDGTAGRVAGEFSSPCSEVGTAESARAAAASSGMARSRPRGAGRPGELRLLGRFQPDTSVAFGPDGPALGGRRDRRRRLAARCPDPRAPRPAGQPATGRMPVSGRDGRRPAAAARPAARRKAGPAGYW